MSALTKDSSLLASLPSFEWKNKLYFGDNLTILREYIPDRSIDLIYLDPPFNSSANYNILFKEKSGEESAAQIHAFEDTWHWGQESEDTLRDLVSTAPERVIELMQALKSSLGRSDMMAYLTMMAPRLVELHRKLKDTGSIYLHCDSTASHYLKLVMDSIFGAINYKNEIIWRRYGAHNDVGQGSKSFGRVHDTILFYTKSKEYKWTQLFTPLNEEYVKNSYRYIEEGTGRYFRVSPLTAPGGAEKGNPVYEWNGHTRSWRYNKETMARLDKEGRLYYSKTGYVGKKLYLDESKGVPVQDVWNDIPALSGAHAERLGYPTQKPEALLERIIKASSNQGDIVLDPFCGCGTSISVAEHLHRKWIGIDITHLAISVIKSRVHDHYQDELSPYEVTGVPTDLAGAEALALQDRYEFQYWALYLLAARPAQDKKKGRDSGIDGLLYFYDGDSTKPQKIVIQVKSGHVKPDDIRALIAVVRREKAQIGAFITLKHPTRDMKTEAMSAGYYKSDFYGPFPKIQILTIEELLDGAELQYPHVNRAKPKRAERKTKRKQHELFTDDMRKQH
jgi:site-specific DNA-methyltransferase (adenine-specific)